MKHISACLLTFCLIAANARAETMGPLATLAVKQIPRVGADEALTPLPPEELLPEDTALPPVAGAMPVEKVETASLDAQNPSKTYDMPPTPSPITNASPAFVPPPAKMPMAAAAPAKSSLPFPPSAEDWASRMPLGMMKTVSFTPAEKQEAPAPAAKIHGHGPTHAAAPAIDTEEETPLPPRIIHSAQEAAPQTYVEDTVTSTAPQHIVVNAGSTSCRGYTRNAGGEQASGTACRGPDGVWRIADEHLVVMKGNTPLRVRATSPVYYAAQPAYHVALGATRYGLGYGLFRHWR